MLKKILTFHFQATDFINWVFVEVERVIPGDVQGLFLDVFPVVLRGPYAKPRIELGLDANKVSVLLHVSTINKFIFLIVKLLVLLAESSSKDQ